MYRITSNGPGGMNRTMTSYPDEAVRQAQVAIDEGRDEVWISDDEGRLFTIEEFSRFIDGAK